MKDILESVKESCQVVFLESSKFYGDLNVKLMGSYIEIEAYEKAKEVAEVKTEK